MKVTTTILAVSALITTYAAAVPHASKKPTEKPTTWTNAIAACHQPGAPCHMAKRAAFAIAEAMPQLAPETRHARPCALPGQFCARRRSDLEAVEAAISTAYDEVVKREAAAEAHRHGLGCGMPGGVCKREAQPKPEPEPRRHHGLACGMPGQPCNRDVKREAEPEAAAHRHGLACGMPGQPCNRDVKREAEPEAAAHRHGLACGMPGQPCNRDVEAARSFCGLRGGCVKEKREAEAAAHWGRPCGMPGQPCNRDLSDEAANTIAGVIKKEAPGSLKQSCFEEGGECDALLKAHRAFQQVKREAAESAKTPEPATKIAFCNEKNSDCGTLAHAHLHTAKNDPTAAKKAEDECYGPNGECAIARRDLEALETTLDSAVANLQEAE